MYYVILILIVRLKVLCNIIVKDMSLFLDWGLCLNEFGELWGLLWGFFSIV